MTEWQDISTAPRDGRRILVSDSEQVGIAKYEGDKGEVLIGDYPKPYWEPYDNSFWMLEGDWFDAKFWMPLPEPPDHKD